MATIEKVYTLQEPSFERASKQCSAPHIYICCMFIIDDVGAVSSIPSFIHERAPTIVPASTQQQITTQVACVCLHRAGIAAFQNTPPGQPRSQALTALYSWECLGERIVLPTGSVFQKQGQGIGSGRDFISGCFRKSVGEAYRSRLSNLVARTKLPPGLFLTYQMVS